MGSVKFRRPASVISGFIAAAGEANDCAESGRDMQIDGEMGYDVVTEADREE